MALTDRQTKFCQEYIIDANAAQAAARAGYSDSYAHKLLKKPGVRAGVEALLAEIKDRRIADAAEVMETLTRMLRREIPETVVVMCKTSRSFYDDNGKRVTETTEAPTLVELPTRVPDMHKAVELMGRRYGLFTEKGEPQAEAPVIIYRREEEA